MKKFFLILFASVLVGCSTPPTPKQPTETGYDAIRFAKQVTVRDHAINTYRFPPGAVFISDRYGLDERTIYCGLAFINQGPTPLEVCIGYEAPTTVIIGTGTQLYEVKRTVPTGSIQRTAVKP